LESLKEIVQLGGLGAGMYEDNIKTDLEKAENGSANVVQVAQNIIQRRALASNVVNTWGPVKAWEFIGRPRNH
jgi:hypothetical protein